MERLSLKRSLWTALVASVCAAACAGPEQYVFVETLGSDTTAIEEFTRTDDGISGRFLQRWTRTTVTDYEGRLNSDGTIAEFRYTRTAPAENPDGGEPLTVMFRFDGGRATVIQDNGGSVDTVVVDAPAGTIPLMGKPAFSYAVHQQSVRQAEALGGDSVGLAFLRAGRSQTEGNMVLRYSADSVALSYFGYPLVVTLDGSGNTAGMSGARTTMKVSGTRVRDLVAFDALAADFASRDARGEGMGVASPSAAVQATIGRANFSVDYSSPARRGRQIFGELVPWNEIWRTGANSATHVSFDTNIELGGATLKAGTYTMWSTFTPQEATLIINAQTGQWGTVYDAAQDVLRVPMMRHNLHYSVERFTIDIAETDGGNGELSLTWGETKYSVPIVVP